MRRFSGKTAVVTGGSRGLGRAIAVRLAEEGADILITGRTAGELEAAVSQMREAGATAYCVVANMGHRADVEDLAKVALERLQRVDILVNNAGLYDEAPFLEIQKDNWDYVLAVLLTGPFLLSQRLARQMVDHGRGAIINIASIDAHGADGPYASYSVAKAGLVMLTKNIAAELGPHGVRCNAISPGWARTPMVESAMPAEMLERMSSSFHRVPAGRLIDPGEVAAVCAFLASDEASGVNGAEFVVDGGTLADLHILPTVQNERGSA